MAPISVLIITLLLFYWRILPPIIRGFSWLLERTLGVGGAVGLATAANIFVGMVEAPLFIAPTSDRLSRSELFIVMTGGMAGIAGTVFVVYATLLRPIMPDVAVHLLTVLSGLAPPPLADEGSVGYRAASHKEGRTRMRCLECGSEAVTERPERTAQGYRQDRCRTCAKQFNERSGGVLNRTQYPSDVIALVVLWRLRYSCQATPRFTSYGDTHFYEGQRSGRAGRADHTSLRALGSAVRSG